MLARLDADERIAEAYLSSDGLRLLLGGAPGVSPGEVSAACEASLEQTVQATPLPELEAERAWSQRHDEVAWLAYARVWTLSWSEAETFADRLLAVLVDEQGEALRALRPVLVEAFFEGVRPRAELGPAPTHWERGAPPEVRRGVLLELAAEQLSAEQLAGLRALLEDKQRVDAIVRDPPPELSPIVPR